MRQFTNRYSGFTALLFAAALVLRVVVPQGFMPVFDHGVIEIGICNGVDGATMTLNIPMEKHGQSASERCAYADLSLPALPGVDPIQLAIALLFVLTLWLTRVHLFRLAGIGHLRPPLRGPPLSA